MVLHCSPTEYQPQFSMLYFASVRPDTRGIHFTSIPNSMATSSVIRPVLRDKLKKSFVSMRHFMDLLPKKKYKNVLEWKVSWNLSGTDCVDSYGSQPFMKICSLLSVSIRIIKQIIFEGSKILTPHYILYLLNISNNIECGGSFY